MRVLLAVALIAGWAVALPGAADARRGVRAAPAYGGHHRYYQPRYYRPRGYYYGPPGYAYRPPDAYSSERAACEARAQAEDPAGIYAGYPCWARSAFGRGSSGGHR